MKCQFAGQILNEARPFSGGKYFSVKVLVDIEVVTVNFRENPNLNVGEVCEITGNVQVYKGNLNVWA